MIRNRYSQVTEDVERDGRRLVRRRRQGPAKRIEIVQESKQENETRGRPKSDAIGGVSDRDRNLNRSERRQPRGGAAFSFGGRCCDTILFYTK